VAFGYETMQVEALKGAVGSLSFDRRRTYEGTAFRLLRLHERGHLELARIDIQEGSGEHDGLKMRQRQRAVRP
jgi:hypothetical protein